MSRLRRVATQDRFFFITTNLAQKVRPLAPAERDIVVDQLAQQVAEQDFVLFAHVVMPTHLHLLLAPYKQELTELMRRLKFFTAQQIAAEREKAGKVWQPRYFDFVLPRAGDFWTSSNTSMRTRSKPD